MNNSRTAYSIRNSMIGVIGKIITILGGYITRVVLVQTIAQEYVGINGLFVTIIGGFSIANMEIETAMAYSLYAPVARGDTDKQRALIHLYAKIYRVFAGLILALGLCFYPFLPLLVRGEIDMGSVSLIYGLFLLNTIMTYFWSARRLMFFVNQQNYINELFISFFWIVQYAAQCVILLWTKNFVLYLAVAIFCIVARNLCITLYANRKYPFLLEPSRTVIPPEERRTITRNLRAMMIHKSGHVIINNTDNLLITSMFGVKPVGGYSNYVLIVGSVHQLFSRLISGISASVGNIGATEKKEQVTRVHETSLFAAVWIYGFGTVCLVTMLEPIIRLSFGEQYILPWSMTLVLCLNFYLNGVRKATLVFRDSLGLFWHDRYKTPVEAIVNLLFSILLTRFIGLTGIVLGTTVSIVAVSMWVEPLVLYREYLKAPVSRYFLRLFKYSAWAALAGGITWALCGLAQGQLLLALLFRGILCAVIFNAVFCLLSFRSPEAQLLYHTVLSSVLRRLGKLFRRKESEKVDRKM